MKKSDVRINALCELKICLARMAGAVGEYEKSVLYYEEAADIVWQCVKAGDGGRVFLLIKLLAEYMSVRRQLRKFVNRE